jgi:hypothetical protein
MSWYMLEFIVGQYLLFFKHSYHMKYWRQVYGCVIAGTCVIWGKMEVTQIWLEHLRHIEQKTIKTILMLSAVLHKIYIVFFKKDNISSNFEFTFNLYHNTVSRKVQDRKIWHFSDPMLWNILIYKYLIISVSKYIPYSLLLPKPCLWKSCACEFFQF